MLKLNQSGDTIVEVAIAIAILGAVIGSGYEINNKAIQIGTDAKFRAEAAALQQGQAEALRSLRDNSASWADFSTAQIGALKMGSTPSPNAAPCTDPAFTNNVFYLSVVSGDWHINRGAVGSTVQPYKECIIASDSSGGINKLRFDIYITWPTHGITNTSVTTTYLEDTTGLISP